MHIAGVVWVLLTTEIIRVFAGFFWRNLEKNLNFFIFGFLRIPAITPKYLLIFQTKISNSDDSDLLAHKFRKSLTIQIAEYSEKGSKTVPYSDSEMWPIHFHPGLNLLCFPFPHKLYLHNYTYLLHAYTKIIFKGL